MYKSVEIANYLGFASFYFFYVHKLKSDQKYGKIWIRIFPEFPDPVFPRKKRVRRLAQGQTIDQIVANINIS